MAKKTITVEQTGSRIRQNKKQHATLTGLGLNKMHKRCELEDTPAIRGMINSIPHLVTIVEDKK